MRWQCAWSASGCLVAQLAARTVSEGVARSTTRSAHAGWAAATKVLSQRVRWSRCCDQACSEARALIDHLPSSARLSARAELSPPTQPVANQTRWPSRSTTDDARAAEQARAPAASHHDLAHRHGDRGGASTHARHSPLMDPTLGWILASGLAMAAIAMAVREVLMRGRRRSRLLGGAGIVGRRAARAARLVSDGLCRRAQLNARGESCTAG